MSQQTIYWARPITSYSRTHKNAIEDHQSGKETLSDAKLKLHCDLLVKCMQLENEVYTLLQAQGFTVVDPGSQEVSSKFEAWRNQSDENKEKPMPFFTRLAESCSRIVFSCFDDALKASNVPNTNNRIGCGVVAEVNAWAHAKGEFNIPYIGYIFDNQDVLYLKQSFLPWPSIQKDAEKLCDVNFVIIDNANKTLTCLNYPQTKALLVLQGYKSRSSQYKNN